MTDKSSFRNTVILLTREGMGSAEPVLQQKLLETYLRLLIENETLPAAICFFTEGVKLVVEGSAFLEPLARLEQAGVHLVVCSTCLNYYGLMDKVRVGIADGMGDILEAQVKADKVITL